MEEYECTCGSYFCEHKENEDEECASKISDVEITPSDLTGWDEEEAPF